MFFQKYVRSNRKAKKLKKKQNPEGNVSARVSSESFFFGVLLFFVFFSFFFNRAKSFLVELWADKRMQKVDLGGGRIYIYVTKNLFMYIYIYVHIFTLNYK